MPKEFNGEIYYTLAEAARYMKVARETFARNTHGRIRPYKIGVFTRDYYKKSDLDALMGVRPAEDNEEENQ
jgi:hypothetical protein